MLPVITDNLTVNMQAVIGLVQEQYPDRQDVIAGLRNAGSGNWSSKGYYRFVDSIKANEPGAEWQHDECIVVEHQANGDIVIDLLKDGRIGGLEFIDLIEK